MKSKGQVFREVDEFFSISFSGITKYSLPSNNMGFLNEIFSGK